MTHHTPTQQGRKRRRGRAGKILIAVALGLLIPLFVVEIALRANYHSLPLRLQIELYPVRWTPFTEERIGGPLMLVGDDPEFGVVAQPIKLEPETGAPLNAPYHMTNYAWSDARVAFRSPQPDPEQFKIVALGDSFTFCWSDDGECWTDYLSASINTPVVNMGQPGTGSVSHMRLYFRYINGPTASRPHPKLVIWQFFANDFNDDYTLAVLNGTNKLPPLPGNEPMSPFQRWLRENSAIYSILFRLVHLSYHEHLYNAPYVVRQGEVEISFGHPFFNDLANMDNPRNQEGEPLTYDAVLKVREAVEKTGNHFVVLVIPTKEEVFRALTEPKMGKEAVDLLAEPRLRFLKFCAANNLLCLDTLPALEANANRQVYYVDDLHTNALGNRVIADALAAFLRQQGYVQ